MLILYITLCLFIIYGILILYYWQSWSSVPEFVANHTSYSTKASIIIPARNEEKNIAQLLQALEKQTYPPRLFEIIVINDHSTDKTVEIVQQFPRVLLSDLENEVHAGYKKKSIEQGVTMATGRLIITTDADCIPPPTWI